MADAEKTAPTSDYDQFVDWNKRLAREMPFFEDVFASVAARTVVDVGAGSARHAIAFALLGMSVDAVDPDDSMLAQAATNIAEAAERIAEVGGEVRLVRAGFGELASIVAAPADALVCTGNALPHVDGHAGLRSTLADFAAVMRPGGVVVLHLLNHERLLAKRPSVIPPVLRNTADGVKVFLRVIEYPQGGEFLDFDFLTLQRDAEGEWDLTHRRSPHTALPAELLTAELEAAGFAEVKLYGGHDGHALTDADESVIVVATRSAR